MNSYNSVRYGSIKACHRPSLADLERQALPSPAPVRIVGVHAGCFIDIIHKRDHTGCDTTRYGFSAKTPREEVLISGRTALPLPMFDVPLASQVPLNVSPLHQILPRT